MVISLTVSLSYNALTYLNFNPQYGFLRLKQEAIETGWYLPFYYSHVLVAGLVLVGGLVQLSARVRIAYPVIHRSIGYFYVLGIVFFAAPGGLVMSFFIDRGPLVLSSFLLQTSLWFYFTVAAVRAARKKDFKGHQLWMWRSYALTFAAVTLRAYILVATPFVDLSNPLAYGVFAWLSWVPNLLLVELIRSPAVKELVIPRA